MRNALAQLQADAQLIADQAKALAASGKRMYVSTEPDAGVMRSLNSAPGYNLQTAVEAGSHLIVAHEVCTDANDQTQLQPMAEAASEVLQSAALSHALSLRMRCKRVPRAHRPARR